MKIVTLGLSISSSRGNGHASTFRSLYKGLKKCGHELYFLERDMPWYMNNRDFTSSEDFELYFYPDLEELKSRFEQLIRNADVVIVCSYLPEGVQVIDYIKQTAQGITIFYDMDTPLTLEKLVHYDYEYIRPEQIRLFDFYLSFSGGKALEILKNEYNAQRPRPFYCSYDEEIYQPVVCEEKWILGYLGTYTFDRQPGLDQLLLKTSRFYPGKYVVAGPSYPDNIQWPANVEHINHLPSSKHRDFYCSQRFTVNVTRKAMKALGHSPSVRLFEAAACGTPIISDWWEGLDEFFTPGEEIILAHTTKDVTETLEKYDKAEAQQIGLRGRKKVLERHSGYARARQLEQYVGELTKVSA